jgi:predicted HTH transcriptional regulator
MESILFFIAGIALGYWLGKRARQADPRHDKVMALFKGREEIYNDLVESSLDVSDATAERLLSELEESGDIVQVGKTGSGVVYRKK